MGERVSAGDTVEKKKGKKGEEPGKGGRGPAGKARITPSVIKKKKTPPTGFFPKKGEKGEKGKKKVKKKLAKIG